MGLGRKKGPGGGGGVGAVLTVTAPAGVTVSVSKDGKTKTKTANVDGLAVFKGLATGTWTLTITDGVQTSTTTVVITADYNATIAFFSATINITYPAGSTCTCSDGSTTLTAPDTSGTWACVVPNAGTWTVSCTDGTESTDETVEITEDGQIESVELSYDLQLIGKHTFTTNHAQNASIIADQSGITMNYSASENFISVAYVQIDLSDYSVLHANARIDQIAINSEQYGPHLCVGKNAFSYEFNKRPEFYTKMNVSSDFVEYAVDISGLSGSYYVGYWGGAKGEITEMWLTK